MHLMQDHMDGGIPHIDIHDSICSLQVPTLYAMNSVLLLLLVPLTDLIATPFLRHIMLHPSILKRLGIGGICVLLSMLSLLTLNGIGDCYFSTASDVCIFNSHLSSQESTTISAYWLVVPMILATLGEILIYIPSKSNSYIHRMQRVNLQMVCYYYDYDS